MLAMSETDAQKAQREAQERQAAKQRALDAEAALERQRELKEKAAAAALAEELRKK